MNSHSVESPAAADVSAILLRAAVCQALALGFTYPSSAVLDQMKARWTDLLKTSLPWPEGVGPLFEQAAQLLHTSDGEALQREHVRLFGPAGGCSLHETAYGEAGRLLGKAAHLADIAGFYLAFGLQPSSTDSHPEDHVSLELEFMSLLAVKEAYALVEGWLDHLEVTRRAQATFIQDHVGTWIDAMAEQLHSSRPHPFYAALGDALRRLVCSEVERLDASPVAISGRLTDPEVGGDTLQCPRIAAGDEKDSAPLEA